MSAKINYAQNTHCSVVQGSCACQFCVTAQCTRATQPTYEPSKGGMDARERKAIILKYERLGCPPESEWGKHGGTLR